MIYSIQILQLIVCIWIFVDDIKNREISIYPVLLLLISGFFYPLQYSNITISENLFQGLQNILIMGFIFSITFLYFKFIRSVKNLFQTHLGVGDILFFLSLIFVGSPISFLLLFLMMSIFSTLIGALGIILLKWKTIPLAGLAAAFLFLLRGSELFSSEYFSEYVFVL